jgi:hypothetical protein
MTFIHRFVPVAGMAILGYCAGYAGDALAYIALARIPPKQENYRFLAERHPLPHHVPEHPGGVSFRFAMVHDILMERFPKHGPAFYRERDRLTRLELARLTPGDPAWFAACDDLAVGLERLGKPDEAAAIMRDKLARQRERGLSGRDLYTSFANLGTFLIHGSIKASQAGDADARARFREGVELIRQSVEVNPQAHFGRERWQATLAEFLLAAMDDPVLLKTYDCLGNRLDTTIEYILDREQNWSITGYGRPYDIDFSRFEAVPKVPAFFEAGGPPDDPARWPEVEPIRRHITKVGAEEGWEALPVPSHKKPVPFDEPMLGIIGMWRQGGGANPHFTLALGETMLRVGQRYIAWEAYQRTLRLADRFWPGQGEQQALREHCKARQAQIETTLQVQALESSPHSRDVTGAELRVRFEVELSFGEAYQQAYQEYEAAKIAVGVPIDDEHFFDEFFEGKEPIASPSGPEEWYVGVPREKMADYGARRARGWGVFVAGVAAMATALLIRWRAGR